MKFKTTIKFNSKLVILKISFLFLIISNISFSQSIQDSLQETKIILIENQLKSNKDSLAELKREFRALEKMIDISYSGISNQLSASSYNLTYLGILIGVLGIILGVYVTNVSNKIANMGTENEDLLKKNKQIKSDVESLNNLIQNDINGLYLKIKREELTKSIDRLVLIPEDITNFLTIL